MKTTPFHQIHLDAGAKMGEFAGFDMPLFYPLGVMKEHLHTRAHAGLFDVSHMVHVEVSGAEAARLIERLCPYHASKQEAGKAQYSFFMNEDAGIKDDLIITRLGQDHYLLVVNAGCADKDVAHIRATAKEFDVSVDIISRAFLALQGPGAEAVLADQGFDVAGMAFMSGTMVGDGLKPGWFLSRTGYTGEDGFEIGLPEGEAVEFAQKLTADERVEWIGLGARDSLRLEAGLPLYGQDLAEDITPHEAGLLWAVPKDLREGGPFIGADALAAKVAEGRSRMRIALLPDGRPIRGGTELCCAEGKTVGLVTSGGYGPTIGAPMALGLIDIAAKDTPLFADMRGKLVLMNRAKAPFTPHNYKR